MKPNQTTAARLLDLVFEGHAIRSVMQDGKPLFVATDVAAACGISKAYDVIKNHVDSHHLTSISLEVRSANGTIQNRAFQCLTQGGVFCLVMGSRKPAASRFQNWLADEVLPQLLKYGSYLPGATPSERLAALARRVTQERAACVTASEAIVAPGHLMTLRAFRVEHAIPARDILPIARRLQLLAKADGTRPVKLTLPGHPNPANAWPRPLLAAATNSTIPRLF